MNENPGRAFKSGEEVFHTYIPGYGSPEANGADGSPSQAAEELANRLLSPLRDQLNHLQMNKSNKNE